MSASKVAGVQRNDRPLRFPLKGNGSETVKGATFATFAPSHGWLEGSRLAFPAFSAFPPVAPPQPISRITRRIFLPRETTADLRNQSKDPVAARYAGGKGKLNSFFFFFFEYPILS